MVSSWQINRSYGCVPVILYANESEKLSEKAVKDKRKLAKIARRRVEEHICCLTDSKTPELKPVSQKPSLKWFDMD